jgi:arylsulfatase A-like enzyme
VPYRGEVADADGRPLAHSSLPGEVLTPVLRGDALPVRKNALVEGDRRKTELGLVQMRAIVTNDYKLVYYAPTKEIMLFDRKSDPQELKNIAEEPEYQSVVNDLFKLLLAELSRTETHPKFGN